MREITNEIVWQKRPQAREYILKEYRGKVDHPRHGKFEMLIGIKGLTVFIQRLPEEDDKEYYVLETGAIMDSFFAILDAEAADTKGEEK